MLMKKRIASYEKEWTTQWLQMIDHFPLTNKQKYKYLSTNSNISMEYFLENQDKPWNLYDFVITNKNITAEVGLVIEENLRTFKQDYMDINNEDLRNGYTTNGLAYTDTHLRGLIWDGVSRGNITIEMVLNHIDKPWSWRMISKNENIKMEDVLSHPDLPWDWYYLTLNPSITVEDVLRNPDHAWSWYFVSKKERITLNHILNNPTIPWNFNGFCECLDYNNIEVSIDFVVRNLDKPWNMPILSRLPSIRLQDILRYPALNWSWWSVSENPSIKMQDVLQNPQLEWHWEMLSRNPSITMEDVSNNLQCNWDWPSMSFNPNITTDFVMNHLDKPWNWDYLSMNENIEMDLILQTLNKPWSFLYLIGSNRMTESKKRYIEKKKKEWENSLCNMRVIQRNSPNIPAEVFGIISEYL
jgi:hypothetical protein